MAKLAMLNDRLRDAIIRRDIRKVQLEEARATEELFTYLFTSAFPGELSLIERSYRHARMGLIAAIANVGTGDDDDGRAVSLGRFSIGKSGSRALSSCQ